MIPTLRSMWSRVVPDPGDMHAANALQSAMYDLFAITGPLLAAALVAIASAEVAIAFTATALLVADFTFAMQSPVRAWRPDRRANRDVVGALGFAGLRTLVGCSLPAGIAIGIVDIAVPAFADQHGARAAAGFPLAALAVGSIVGGLLYGGITWRSSPTEEAQVASAYNAVVEAVQEKDYEEACEGLTERTREALRNAATIEGTDGCGATLARVITTVGVDERALTTAEDSDVEIMSSSTATVGDVRMSKQGEEWRLEGDVDFVRPLLSGESRSQ